MKLANNPFTDDQISTDRKQYCGKCYKINHREKRCEKFDTELKLLCPGRLPVFEKCEACKKSVVK